MQVGIYTFECRFKTGSFLPLFKGSTLRGGFGHALKRIVCALRRQECATCLLAGSCAYAFLFEVKDNPRRPHPYVLVPPDDPKRIFEPNDSFTFQFILFGRANDYLPHIVYAVKEMGENGLGKKSSAEGCFALEKIFQAGEIIYAGETLHTPSSLRPLSLTDFSGPMNGRLALSCLTPLRLKYTNELQDSLPFHVVIRAALRRISTLEAAYGPGEPDLDYRGMVSRAFKVDTVAADCRWQDIERYSNRQKSAMFFGGVQGRIVYAGEHLAEFMPLLRYCEVTHLGKQTSFGLGKIAVGEAPAP